jgi:hypothetical protein
MSELIWIDESARTSANGIVYVVAGVRAEGDSRPVHRLDELRFPAQRYLHWRDEPAVRRREFVSVTNELALHVTVAVAHAVPPRRQERARAACLALVARDALQSPEPVTGFRIEGRGQQLDKHDEFTVTDVVRRIRHQPSPLIEFVPKSASPILWVADAVAWMASTHFSDAPGSDHWWRSLRPSRLTILHVEP